MKKDKKEDRTPSSWPSENDDYPDYPAYPADDDIYKKYKEEDLTPASKIKGHHERHGRPKDEDFNEDIIGSDLDVPGSELDDEQENIGSEDEENNYYSLGDDDHHDLDEDKVD